ENQLPDHVNLFCRQLGAEDWRERESAQSKLIESGRKLIAEYQQLKFSANTTAPEIDNAKDKLTEFVQSLKAAARSKDPEIRMRIIRKIIPVFRQLTASKIAFCSNRDGNEEIYVMPARALGGDADGQNQVNLTKHPGRDRYCSWSPDGTRIVFSSWRDGSPSRANLAKGGNANIYVMNSDGTNQTRLTKHPAEDWIPAWSPDGQKILFQSHRDNKKGTYLMDGDGKNQKILLEQEIFEGLGPLWKPDGQEIIFLSRPNDLSGVIIVNLFNTEIKRISKDEWQKIASGWPADTKKLIFGVKENNNYEIYIMDIFCQEEKNITENKGNDGWPMWGPDGKSIAFYSNRNGRWGIYVMDSQGGNIRGLSIKDDYDPAWSPAVGWLSELFEISEKD
ncbi:MAG: hypothetical protein AAB019_01455, partial [Planctomycetota bacterium]